MQVSPPPPDTRRTHTGVGPAGWGAAHPPARGCPALSRWPPPDLRPRKVVPASHAPCQKSLRAPGYLQPLRPGARPREGTGAAPLPPLPPPGPRQPGTHAPTPAAPGIFPHVQEGPGAGSTDAHPGRTCPGTDPRATASPRWPAAAAMPARPAPSPPPLPTADSGLHAGSCARSSAGSKCHRHFPAVPRLRVPGATSAKACAPGGERRLGRSVCWEL